MRKYILPVLLLILMFSQTRAQKRVLNLNKKELKKKFVTILKKDNGSALSIVEEADNENYVISEEDFQKKEEKIRMLLEQRKRLRRSVYRKGDSLPLFVHPDIPISGYAQFSPDDVKNFFSAD